MQLRAKISCKIFSFITILNKMEFGKFIEFIYAHILKFLEVYDTIKNSGVSEDAICLRLFPFSLKDKAKHSLTIEPPDSTTSWMS